MGTYQHGGKLLAEAVRAAYREGISDYSMEPLVRIGKDGKPMGLIRDGDSVIFCCRRGEREIELTEAFTDPEFSHFERKFLKSINFVILTLYHEKFKNLPVAFAPAKIQCSLAETISKAGFKQLHCAESEKFAHVTYFFNGGNQPFPGEIDRCIPSPKGVPFDQIPALSLPKVADEVIQGIHKGYEFIVTNFANGDVLGHTDNCEAKITCASNVDFHLGRVIEAARKQGYVIGITADHGNLEVMLTDEGKPHVAHTSNPAPFILIDGSNDRAFNLCDGKLCDIAPTILQVLGLDQPAEITGTSLAPLYIFGIDRKMLLIILDGWGIGKSDHTNPIFLGNTPVWDDLTERYPYARLCAAGEAVGLQKGKAGNSEAGHINMGSGRVVLQDDVRLDQAIKDGSFESNEIFLQTIKWVKENHRALHLIVLLTKKSSHGSIDYPLALLKMAKDLPEIYIHIIFDGRSTEPGSAPRLLEELDERIQELEVKCQIVSGIGRGLALDRDGNYEKIKKAYECMVLGVGMPYEDICHYDASLENYLLRS
ncbi:MAG TPA: phosphoglycerate mutase (2,3-diphosphoglycerate-independent) [Ruminiclostridium sp.]|nr:phosphoglycerate mutase (2,3-diphosphoglycerate-independent) [Ruminiclostridium sp.]